MPVSYTVDPGLRLIRTRCTGHTTLPQVMAHFAELRARSDLPQPLDVLLDFTEMTGTPSLDQLEQAAVETASLTPGLRWGAMAIIVADEQAQEFSRVYIALINHYFEQVRVFHDNAEAEAWLGSVRADRPTNVTGG
jgi:hypothetical protein